MGTRFLHCNKMPIGKHEDILIFYKSLPTYNPQMQEGKPYKDSDRKRVSSKSQNLTDTIRKPIDNDGYRYPDDIIKFSNGNNHSIHPTQKPVALFEYLIRTYTNEGELVLDNCSGSGTTAIACMNTNRQFICIERDETYHRKSIERLANHEPLLHMGDKC